MTETLAADAPPGIASFGEYGLAGLVILALFCLIYKFGLEWVKSSHVRENRDAEIRKQMYAAFNNLAKALEQNSDVTERHIAAIGKLSSSVGRLPCTYRDPAIRTRAGDFIE